MSSREITARSVRDNAMVKIFRHIGDCIVNVTLAGQKAGEAEGVLLRLRSHNS